MIIAKRLLSCAAAILIFVSNGLNSLFNGDIYPFDSLTKCSCTVRKQATENKR